MEAELPDWLDDERPVELRFAVSQRPVNYAPRAKVSVSSAYNRTFAGSMAVDGVKGVHQTNEWSSAGESTPWIQLDWPEPVSIGVVRLFDRSNPDDHTRAGTLTFSDGSRVEVADMANDGSMKTVTFDAKTVTWVKFQVTRGSGSNLGLSEIEALSGAALEVHSAAL